MTLTIGALADAASAPSSAATHVGPTATGDRRARLRYGRGVVATLTSILALGAALTAAGCGGDDGALRVLAGSELADVKPLLEQLERDTGVKLDLELTGTLEGAERIAQGEKPAMAWYPSSRYVDLLTRHGARKPVASARTMLSPVVIGVKQSVAQRFGWDRDTDVTWRDIAAKSKTRRFNFAMTNPAASNSGFSALVSVASAFADTGKALTSSDIDAPRLKGFFKGQTLTAGSSGFLVDEYVGSQDRLDGMVNYESVLLRLNATGRLREKLVLMYPRDGIVTADYPLLLTDPAYREAWEKVRNWLRRPEIQTQLMRMTRRRPILPQVPLSGFPARSFVEVPFPASREVVDDLLITYFDEIRAPAHTIFALDLSFSMRKQGRLDNFKTALRNLSGADTSLTGRYARFRRRERITVIPFRSEVLTPREFVVDTNDAASPVLARIRDYADGLEAAGGTALFAAARRAYREAEQDKAQDTGYVTTIVVMADGGNNQPPTSVTEHLRTIPASVSDVRTFAVQLGEAEADELERMAKSTGGRVFDASKRGLADAFKEIRGYQ